MKNDARVAPLKAGAAPTGSTASSNQPSPSLKSATQPHYGIALIAAERRRQIADEGWTPTHDDGHTTGQLARAAACYALQHTRVSGRAIRWPWHREWWKPSADPIRNLVKAGALIAAEIERLHRQAEGRS